MSLGLIEQYRVPSQTLVIEEEIKHSRFISLLFHCPDAEVMKQMLAQAKIDYPGASHYCYAFVAGMPSNTIDMGSSDDGEPAGSAGRPMLATLQGAQLGEIGALVVRYFGGTKLGVGGLVRAYSSGIKQGLNNLSTQVKFIRQAAKLKCQYSQLADVEHLIQKYHGVIVDRRFTEAVELDFELALSHRDHFILELAAMSQGCLIPEFAV